MVELFVGVILLILVVVYFFYSVFRRHLSGTGEQTSALHEQQTDDVEASRQVIDRINSAHSLLVKQHRFTVVERWTVSVDGEPVGDITGLYGYLVGQTYSLRTDHSVLVSSIERKPQLINEVAHVYDYNNNDIGRIEQRQEPLFFRYLLIDRNGETVGEMDQKGELTMSAEISNAQGEVEWRMRTAMFSTTHEFTAERLVESPAVSAINAVWLFLLVTVARRDQQERRQIRTGQFSNRPGAWRPGIPGWNNF